MTRGADILAGLLHHASQAAALLEGCATTLAGLPDDDFRDVMTELARDDEHPAAPILANLIQPEGLKRYLSTSPAHA